MTALRTGALRKLVDGGHIQFGLFDERNLFEVTHPDLPGERLVACRNPQLALLRTHTRQSLLEATSRELENVRGMISRGTIKGKNAIGVRIGKLVDKYKMSKHLVLDIRDDGFDFHLNDDKVSAEAALDGIYVVRTSVSAQLLATDDVVRSYKMLSQVERAFRSLKTIDLEVHYSCVSRRSPIGLGLCKRDHAAGETTDLVLTTAAKVRSVRLVAQAKAKTSWPSTSRVSASALTALTPKKPLVPGEYAFFISIGSSPQGQAWDFGVDPK